MLAAFNPCGFAMLPAYLGWFLGLDSGTGQGADRAPGVLRSLVVGACVTLGFISVFAVFGILIRQFSVAIYEFTPYLTLAFGILLVPLGLYLLSGRQLKLRVPTVKRGPRERTLPAVVAFGASYAVVSLGCTLPLFLGPIASTLNRDLASGLATFVAYSVGFALILTSLTLAVGLARGSLVRHFRRVLPYVSRASGALLIVTGVYVAYYGWYEFQIFVRDNPDVNAGPVDWVTDRTNDLATWVTDTGPIRLGIVLSALLVAAVALVVLRSRRRRPGDPPTPDAKTPAGAARR